MIKFLLVFFLLGIFTLIVLEIEFHYAWKLGLAYPPPSVCKPKDSFEYPQIPADYPQKEDMESMKDKVRNLMMSNLVSIDNNDTNFKSYTSPSGGKGHYPQQFLWDSVSHILIKIELGEIDFAKAEFRAIFDGQHDNGMLAHEIFRDGQDLKEKNMYVSKDKSDLTQPPIIWLALSRLLEHGEIDFTKEYLPKVELYFQYLRDNRDFSGTGLISVIHPWETGWDASPSMDKTLGLSSRPTRLEIYLKQFLIANRYKKDNYDLDKIRKDEKHFEFIHVGYNSIYIAGLKSLAKINRNLAASSSDESERYDYSKDADMYDKLAAEVLNSLINLCWSDEKSFFFDLEFVNGEYKQTEISTLSGVLPLLIENLPEKYVSALQDHLKDENEFWTPYPIPVVAQDEETFCAVDEPLIWRGGTWVLPNYLVITGLKEHGKNELALEIAQKTFYMVYNSDFYERYNPYTGKGDRTPNYGWSAVAYVAMKQCLEY